MGSYASQTNELERWQITQHVMNLKAALNGEPLLTPVVEGASMETIVSEELEQADGNSEAH